MGKYTLADLQPNIESIVRAKKEENIKPCLALQANATLWVWADAHNMTQKIITSKDIALVEPFWGLLETFDIKLTDEEKKEIFQNFLED
jgi:hypothetical protein